MIFRDYPELCEHLGEPIKSGASKRAQIKEWKTMFIFEKLGRKLKIIGIYDIMMSKIDMRGKTEKSRNNATVYKNHIKNILLDYLEKNKSKPNFSILSITKIFEILGMTNKNYSIGNYNRKEVSEILNINLSAVHYFFNTTKNDFTKTIDNTLKSLENEMVIISNKIIIVVEKKVALKDDKEIEQKIYHQPSKEQIEKIIDIQKRAMQENEIESLNSFKFITYSKKIKYNRMIKEEMIKLYPNYSYHFFAYDLRVGKGAVAIQYGKDKEKIEETLNLLSIAKVNKTLKVNKNTNYTVKQQKNLIECFIELMGENKIDIGYIYEKKYAKQNQMKKLANYVNRENIKELMSTGELSEMSEVYKENIINDYDNRDKISYESYKNYENDIKNNVHYDKYNRPIGLQKVKRKINYGKLIR